MSELIYNINDDRARRYAELFRQRYPRIRFDPAPNLVLARADGRIVTAGEVCDDAGASPTCDTDCTLPWCGDGTPNAPAGEECDDGGYLEL